ncbi:MULTISPECIES: polyamine ABC transporter substrate-binding protein [unclassified Pseudomonas]|uniref:polyamine ABC transporter substrate-binding protein n=1 Tax=unclassified Pseudomonas TaxID=196821 RepID=UPI002446B210|nr:MULTISPECIES: polyamine ABC transporter substrate-binding protein [unclassified Pseudomonas]MDG9927560.1 polyamine ABC transporter substrate-binding protein [Pseudomonas sp. GD04042]MDH0485309.1 polyamine ABC transporter substrate-binding protein [Pseudomonas sp. GD04015]MDH0603791.1 polyamine ABC transporter substrate-binding protein [Pseudomonas sp. GD03869]
MQRKSLLALSLAALLVGQGSAQADTPTVHLYNWSDFLAPETPKEFQQETGIATVLDVFDDAEVMQSKLMAGRSGYDVVVVPNDLLPNFAKAGLLQELDRSKLPNWSHLAPDIMGKLEVNDPGNRYAIPYMWGTTGIGYNVDKVRELLGEDAPVDSWELIFNKDNIAKLSQCGVAMLDAPVEILPIALHYLGLPANSKTPGDYQKAEALMRKIRPYIRYFNSAKFTTDLANGDICVVVGWGGSVYGAKLNAENAGNGVKLAYSIPREGAPLWVNTLVVLKDAPNSPQAYQFLDYILRPEITAKNSNYVGYPNGNRDATALVDEHLRNDPMLYPPASVMDSLFPLETLPLKLERVRTRTWSKIKNDT